ncbi:MAG: FG-GAP-like repeat-containing protein [Acidobacteriota bacterium]
MRVATDGTTAPFLDDAFLHEDGSTLELEIARDVDGDGRPDLVLPTGTGVIYRLWREGVPILSAPGADVPVKAVNLEAEAPTLFARVAAEGSPPRLSFLRPIPSARDLDGDGRLDAVLPLAARLAEVEGIRVRFGEEGTPLFGPTERGIEIAHAHGEVLGGEEALAFGDLDGDRVMELGLLTYDVEGLSLRATRRLRVIHFGKGYVPDAAPWLDVDTDANLWEPSRLALDDLDGDGRGDVLVTHIGGLRKASFTAELYRRSASGRFEKEDQTLKIGKDEKVDRSFLPAPVDLDGDGKSDFLVAGKAVVYELGGIFQDGMVFTEPARKVTRIEGADKVLAVLVDPRPKSASPYYVVTRQKNGRNLITRVP